MARFLETDDGFINLDYVRCLRRRKNKHGVHVLVAIDDKGEVHECFSENAAAGVLWPAIPAQPGFFLLSMFFGDTMPNNIAAWLNKDAIIAWRMEELGPEPVIADDPPRGANIQAVQCPDSKIVIPGENSFDTLEAFLVHARDSWQRHLDRKAKAATTSVAAE